jgi:hypothetical protein
MDKSGRINKKTRPMTPLTKRKSKPTHYRASVLVKTRKSTKTILSQKKPPDFCGKSTHAKPHGSDFLDATDGKASTGATKWHRTTL